MTLGNPVGLTALLTNLDPARGSFTAVVTPAEGPPMIGQMLYRLGGRSAHLSFLVPGNQPDSPALLPLLDHLTQQAGEWGAFNLHAEVEERNPLFEKLRRAGFVVYSWQHIWQLNPEGLPDGQPALWRPAGAADEPAVRSLYQCLAPPLVQSAETLPNMRQSGWVYRQDGELLGYVEAVLGPRGVVLQPLIHPSTDRVEALLRALPLALPPLLGRSLYLVVRSYQSWLDPHLENLSARVGPRQALLVRHLAHMQRAGVPVTQSSLLPGMESARPKPTAPIVHSIVVQSRRSSSEKMDTVDLWHRDG